MGKVKDSIVEFDLVESRTLVEKTLNQSLKEFLFDNVQIGFTSQGLVSKASCIELGTPHETQPYLFYQTKIQVWKRGRGRDLVSVWILSFMSAFHVLAFCFFKKHASVFSSGSCVLFMGFTNIFFTKIFIKNRFHDTIHTFKNYFIIVFLSFNFH